MKKDLWICERKTHPPEHDGATGYFYYVPIEPYNIEVPLKTLQWLLDLEDSASEDDMSHIEYLKGLLKCT